MQIDYNDIIDALNKRFDELDKYTFIEPDPLEANRKTLQLHKMLTDLNEEITKYERIRANSASSEVTINPVSPEEDQELRDALASLNVAIQRDQVWHRAISLATTVLEAAAKIRTKAASSSQPGPAPAGLVAAGLAAPPTNSRVETLLARLAKPAKGSTKSK